jgi:hypothetical protein
MEENIEKIFLKNGRILPWKRPPVKGEICMLNEYDGSTELKEFLGFEKIEEIVGHFRLIATSAIYLADIAYLSDVGIRCEANVSGEIEEKILFSGGISIYRLGEISGTNINGYDLEIQDKIWTSVYPYKDLRSLIFSNSSDRLGRIEAIIEGYKSLKDDERRFRRKSENESFELGRRSTYREPVMRGPRL